MIRIVSWSLALAIVLLLVDTRVYAHTSSTPDEVAHDDRPQMSNEEMAVALGIELNPWLMQDIKVVASHGVLEDSLEGLPSFGTAQVAVGDDDDLFVASSEGCYILRYSQREGRLFVHVPPPIGEAEALAYRSSDKLLVWSNPSRDYVAAKFADGSVRIIGDVDQPGTIAVDPTNDRIYVSSALDSLYEVFADGRTPVKVELGDERPRFAGAMSFAPDGRLFVPDISGKISTAPAVSGKDTAFETLYEFAGDFKLCGPHSVVAATKDKLVVVCSSTGQLVAIASDGSGEPALLFESPTHVIEYAASSGSMLFVSNTTACDVSRFKVAQNDQDKSISLENDGLLWRGYAHDMVMSVSGDLLATLHTLNHFVPGEQEQRIVRTHDGSLHMNFYSVSGTEKKILLIDVLSRVVLIDREEGALSTIPNLRGAGQGAFLDERNIALIVEIQTGSLVGVYPNSKEGWMAPEVRLNVTGLEKPVGLAVSDDEQVAYVTDYSAGTVVAVDLNTREKRIVADGLCRPEGIVLIDWDNREKRLVVLETGSLRRILVIDPESTNNIEQYHGRVPTGLRATASLGRRPLSGWFKEFDAEVNIISHMFEQPNSSGAKQIGFMDDIVNGLGGVVFGRIPPSQEELMRAIQNQQTSQSE